MQAKVRMGRKWSPAFPSPYLCSVKPSATALIRWYKRHGRSLPWRQSRNPYLIWISEIILQQTRVQQGLPYFERFIARFPNVHQLAEAPAEAVLKAWEGLGYYSRARNLHAAAKEIVLRYGGKFPETSAELLNLKGIGPYTARAIAAFAFGEKTAVVDGNVFRVLSRLYADSTNIDRPAAKNHFQKRADSLLGKADPGDFNQAIMDLGALVCLPRNPLCIQCPFQKNCLALQHPEGPEGFPVRKAKEVKPVRNAVCYVMQTPSGKFVLRQRPHSGLWGGLFEFPWYESGDPVPDWILSTQWEGAGTVRHVFTHFTLVLKVQSGQIQEKSIPVEHRVIITKQIDNLALPKAMHKILDLIQNK